MTQQGILEARSVEYSGRRFKLGSVESAEMLDPVVVPFRLGEGPKRGAKRRGILYERKVAEQLSLHFPTIRIQPWFKYCARGEVSYCRPDAVLVLPKEVWLFEIKYSHCLDAFWQLSRYYCPVLAKAFALPIRRIEVVRNLDSDVRFPVPIAVSLDFKEFLAKPSYDLATVEVVRWKL